MSSARTRPRASVQAMAGRMPSSGAASSSAATWPGLTRALATQSWARAAAPASWSGVVRARARARVRAQMRLGGASRSSVDLQLEPRYPT